MKKFLLLTIPLAGCWMAFSVLYQPASSFTSGGPAASTGSPGDGQSCARSGCHSGGATNQAGLIGTDIPAGGYVPGTTYNITATVSENGRSKFGFQLSPQDPSGNLLGTLIANANTQLVQAGKYITHISGSTAGTSTKTWAFEWTAPAAGTGDVSFYASFNASNSNNNAGGDIIYLSDTTISEDNGIGIADVFARPDRFKVFPNPATDQIRLELNAGTEVAVFNLAGQQVLNPVRLSADNEQMDVSQLETGVYLIRAVQEGRVYSSRLTVL